MALEEFENEKLSLRDRGVIRVRSISNYAGGILLIGAAVFFFLKADTPPLSDKYEPSTLKMFAIVCSIYGVFRLYRGYKKNYFRES